MEIEQAKKLLVRFANAEIDLTRAMILRGKTATAESEERRAIWKMLNALCDEAYPETVVDEIIDALRNRI